MSKCLFQTSIVYNFDFQWCFKDKTKDLERKHTVHFPRRTKKNEKQKSKYRDPNKQPNPILSMKAKTKTNQKCFSMQMKIVALDQQVQEKHKKLNFQSITDS